MISIIFEQNLYSKVNVIILLILLSFKLTFISARWDDKYDYYDSAFLRKDYLAKYCLESDSSNGQFSTKEQQSLKYFENCTKPGLVFENISTSLTADEFYLRNRTVFEKWCSTWPLQRACEKNNEMHIDKCFTDKPSVSVGFDLMTAFFTTACKKRGETLPYLIIFRNSLRKWWYNERDVVSCFNEMSLEFYRRDINMVLSCLKYQLRYRYCNWDEQSCKTLLNTITEEVKESYSSSGYVYLINLNISLIDKETFPLASEIPTKNCQHAKYAYIAFFSLLTLVLITLGLLVSVKVNCLNLPCYRTHDELVQDDGSNVEL